jgi:hypothetical protein
VWPPGDPTTRLYTSDGHLDLVMRHHYRIVEAEGELGPWKTTTAGYDYTLQARSGEEIIAFHWHPEARGRYSAPHLHAGTNFFSKKRHVPTGRITLEEVLRFGIEELDVQVRPDHKATWDATLAETEKRHKDWRTWG